MAQKRDLHPVTVYLPPDVIKRYEARSAVVYEAVSATLRRILLVEDARAQRLGSKRDTTHS